MIFIPGNTPSSKNSRINTRSGSFFSKTVQNYLKELGVKAFSSSKKEVREYARKPNLFLKCFENAEDWKQYKPLILGYHPVRNSKRAFDLHNCFQIVADLLEAHDIIENDSADYLIPVPMKIDGKYYTIDKDNPGIYLTPLNGKTIEY